MDHWNEVWRFFIQIRPNIEKLDIYSLDWTNFSVGLNNLKVTSNIYNRLQKRNPSGRNIVSFTLNILPLGTIGIYVSRRNIWFKVRKMVWDGQIQLVPSLKLLFRLDFIWQVPSVMRTSINFNLQWSSNQLKK